MIQHFTLVDDRVRGNALVAVRQAPDGCRVTISSEKRNLLQNKRLWATLEEIAKQHKHNGLTLTPEDYKVLFMDALWRETRMVPNLDGNGMVALGRSSSSLTKAEMNDLLTLMEAWCAQNGVNLHDSRKEP